MNVSVDIDKILFVIKDLYEAERQLNKILEIIFINKTHLQNIMLDAKQSLNIQEQDPQVPEEQICEVKKKIKNISIQCVRSIQKPSTYCKCQKDSNGNIECICSANKQKSVQI